MKARLLFVVTAAVEIAIGLPLIVFPSIIVEFLLGSSLSSSQEIILARVAGAALTAIAIACWMSRNDRGSLAAKGLISGLLFYNFAALVILIYAVFIVQFSILLLLAIITHLGLTSWCLFVLQYVRRNKR